MVEVSNGSKYVAEFVGTFMLIFAVGNNVLGGSAVWGATSIACTLMVAIYALGGISGANFNPAVSFALGFTGKMDWGTVYAYSLVQMGAGFAAGVAYGLLHWKVFDIGPASGYQWYHAAFAEFIYTFMLCFVVLNVAASKMDGGKNQYYGLAIGFVIVAGGYGAGHISGGCFNPAVAFGIDISSAALGFGWCFVYAIFEILGAYAASSLFQIIRPEETDPENDAPKRGYKIGSKMVSEFIGTYMLVITVGLNVLGGSTAPAFSIAAALMCMIFALGSVSGAHFNPAVTIAIVMSGRDKCTSQHGEQYIALQILGGVLGAFSYAFLENGKTFPLNPGAGHSWFEACTAETVYTFFLCYIVLCVATVEKAPTPDYFGLVIGACVTTGGYAIGALSGGSLNPAVSVGKCQGVCSIDPTITKGSDAKMGVNGTCSEEVTTPTYDIKLVFNGLPILSKTDQNGCTENKFALPLNMGSLDIKGAKCPVAQGSSLSIPAIANVGAHCPNGKLVATLTAKDKSGASLFVLEYDVTMS